MAAEELAGRVSGHERDRIELQARVSAMEEGEWIRLRKHAVDHFFS